MPVTVESKSSRNAALSIDEDAPLKGLDKEEIEMQEVIVGDQGNTFLLHNIASTYYFIK